VIGKLNDETTPYVVLPIKFHYTNDLNIGDTVTLQISKKYPSETFKIAGFTEWGINEVMITNMVTTVKYKDEVPNAILMQSSNTTKTELIERFANEMYYVLDFNELINREIVRSSQITQYISYIIIVMIVGFMFTIINHSMLEYSRMEVRYARIRVLGCSQKRLMLTVLLEKLLVFFIVIFSVGSLLPLIASSLPHLLLFFGTYEQFYFTKGSIIQGALYGTIMYSISTFLYLYKMTKLELTDSLKQH